MIIGVCGLGYTGSGAVKDLLLEYEDIQFKDLGEFSLCYYPDGLEDLRFHLNKATYRFLSSDVAIKRFRRMIKVHFGKKTKIYGQTGGRIQTITQNFIYALDPIMWQGYWDGDELLKTEFERNVPLRIFQALHRRMKKYFHKSINMYPKRQMYLCQDVFSYDELANQYIKNILESAGLDLSRKILLDQPFSGDAPLDAMRYFNDSKAIVVYRDPRDVYILAKKYQMSSCSWIPQDDICAYIKYMQMMYRNVGKYDTSKVLCLRFEDLIFNYDATVESIEAFLDIKRHTKVGEHFNRYVSANNTCLYKKFPEESANISLIEEKMAEFLFDFDNISGTMKTAQTAVF